MWLDLFIPCAPVSVIHLSIQQHQNKNRIEQSNLNIDSPGATLRERFSLVRLNHSDIELVKIEWIHFELDRLVDALNLFAATIYLLP